MFGLYNVLSLSAFIWTHIAFIICDKIKYKFSATQMAIKDC